MLNTSGDCLTYATIQIHHWNSVLLLSDNLFDVFDKRLLVRFSTDRRGLRSKKARNCRRLTELALNWIGSDSKVRKMRNLVTLTCALLDLFCRDSSSCVGKSMC